jgi:hypothetical protein
MGDAMSHAIPPGTASSWTTAGQPQAGGGVQASAGGGGNPQDIAKSAEKGSLKSPYQDFKKVAEEGHQKFMSAGCNGCHGGTGGGGMGPPLTNQIWVYGSDDDTLFPADCAWHRSIAEAGLQPKGFGECCRPDATYGNRLQGTRRHLEGHCLDQIGQPVLGRRWSRPVGFGSAVSTAVCAIRAIASGKPQIFKR